MSNAFEVTLIPVSGCTDPLACNYDSLANTDDGSCILPDGCTDASAFNYDASATCDDGSCISITNVSPNNGQQGQSMSLTITGTNINYFNQWSGTTTLSPFQFLQNSTASSFSGTPTSASGNDLYGDINITTNQSSGWYDLEVF